MSAQEWDESATKLRDEQSGNRFVNIVKHVWSRVYLNIYDGGDFTEPSELTLEAALWEFFVPTTKRKIRHEDGSRWQHWLGAGHSELSKPKAGLIILIDAVFFLPRLAINIAKLVTEVLPDVIAQLFFLAYKEADEKRKYLQTQAKEISEERPAHREYSALAAAHVLAMGLAFLGTAIFKSLYFIGCCITSPFATSIRAGKFNYQSDKLNKLASFFSHFLTPMVSFSCYMVILFLLANAIPGLGFVLTISGAAFASLMLAYVAVDHLLSCLNRGPNGDNLIDLPGGEDRRVRDQLRYTDRDINRKKAKGFSEESKGAEARIYAEVEEEIQETLKYEHSYSYRPMFEQIKERKGEANPEQQSSSAFVIPKIAGT